MTEMIEKVARAMAEAEGDTWAGWPHWRDRARVAIAAMREPTADMIAANTTGPIYGSVEEGWQWMIAAALHD